VQHPISIKEGSVSWDLVPEPGKGYRKLCSDRLDLGIVWRARPLLEFSLSYSRSGWKFCDPVDKTEIPLKEAPLGAGVEYPDETFEALSQSELSLIDEFGGCNSCAGANSALAVPGRLCWRDAWDE
jgi:hypothetical protein